MFASFKILQGCAIYRVEWGNCRKALKVCLWYIAC